MTTDQAVKRYRVVAPYVTCRVAPMPLGGKRGVGVLGFHREAVLPSDADPASIAHLLANDLIAEVPDA
jgi:hypothetical protein